MRYVSHKSSTENQNTHFTFNNFSENRAVYETMWKNMAELDRTVDNMAHAHFTLGTQGYKHTQNM